MGEQIRSKAVYDGRNFDVGPWRDDRFMRCSRCGWINNLDRNTYSDEGSRSGWGTTFTVVTSTSSGTGFGPHSPVDTMQTPGPQGVMLFNTSLNSTDMLTNGYGNFYFYPNSTIYLNGNSTSAVGVMLLLFEGVMYYVDNSSHWFAYGSTGGSWAAISGDPRLLSGEMTWDSGVPWDSNNTWDGLIGLPVEQSMDAVVGAGCAQCGTLLYTR